MSFLSVQIWVALQLQICHVAFARHQFSHSQPTARHSVPHFPRIEAGASSLMELGRRSRSMFGQGYVPIERDELTVRDSYSQQALCFHRAFYGRSRFLYTVRLSDECDDNNSRAVRNHPWLRTGSADFDSANFDGAVQSDVVSDNRANFKVNGALIQMCPALRAHAAVSHAIYEILEHCKLLAILFDRRNLWSERDVKMRRSDFYMAVDNLYHLNRQRHLDLMRGQVSIESDFARHIMVLLTPLYDLNRVLTKGECVRARRWFDVASAYRHSAWLRRRLPEELVNLVFSFNGDRGLLIRTRVKLRQALSIIHTTGPWQPLISMEKLLLATHSNWRFCQADGRFDYEACRMFYWNRFVAVPVKILILLAQIVFLCLPFTLVCWF